MHFCGTVDIVLFSTIKCRPRYLKKRSSKVSLNSQRLRLRLLRRMGLISAGSGALLFFVAVTAWVLLRSLLIILLFHISFYQFRCDSLPDYILSFTQRRVYKEGDRDLPEFPSHFQVAKYSVFERVSEKNSISINLWTLKINVLCKTQCAFQNSEYTIYSH